MIAVDWADEYVREDTVEGSETRMSEAYLSLTKNGVTSVPPKDYRVPSTNSEGESD